MQLSLRFAARRAAVVFVPFLSHGAATAAVDAPATAAIQNPASRAQMAPDRLLVRFKDGSTPGQRRAINNKLRARVLSESRSVSGLQVVRATSPSTLGATLDAYRRDPNVLYAEPDYRVRFDETLPNDAMFEQLWALRNTGQSGGRSGADINAARAWDLATGRADVYVGVVDSGVDYNHADLAANVWSNAGEIAGNGVDDDGNGYVDDVHGINGFSGSGDPMDHFGHGTHVAGTIAAQGNNGIGVAGVNWNAKVIACSLLDADSLGAFVSGAVRCLDYLYDLKTRRGLDVVATNNSWGWIGGPSRALQDAIGRQHAAGILFVASAGNNALDTSEIAHYPASYDLPNVISVAATDDTDHKAIFSNYGRTSVHIAAPGVAVLSTTPGDSYEAHSGTSMASPHVTGVLALLKAQDPGRDWIKLKNLLLAGGAEVDSMRFTISGRRLLAAGDNGSGALTCVDQNLVHRLGPRADEVTLSYGPAQTLNLSALSISCDRPGAAPSVVVEETEESIALLDDGANGDAVAGDGVFTAPLSIAKNRKAPLTLAFPDGDTVKVSFARNYEVPTTTANQWRDLSAGAREIVLGDDTTHVLPLPFPLRIGDRDEPYRYLAIADNGFVVPTVDEAAAYDVLSSWFNLPLPVSSFDAVIAPFWEDLSPTTSSRVYWALRGTEPQRELVVEWRDFGHYFGDSGTVTFQVVLFEDRADVVFNYADVSFDMPELDLGASATVGIQSGENVERAFSVDSPQLSDGLSLEWRMPKSRGKQDENWFHRTFGGGLDPCWIATLGLAALVLRRRRNGARRSALLPAGATRRSVTTGRSR
jgi:subtilisin family serine protease